MACAWVVIVASMHTRFNVAIMALYILCLCVYKINWTIQCILFNLLCWLQLIFYSETECMCAIVCFVCFDFRNCWWKLEVDPWYDLDYHPPFRHPGHFSRRWFSRLFLILVYVCFVLQNSLLRKVYCCGASVKLSLTRMWMCRISMWGVECL